MKSPLDKLSELNWPDKLLNIIRPAIKVATYLSIGLLVLSWLSVVLVPYIGFMMSRLLGIELIPDADLLNSSTAIILISITGVYVLLTHDIVKENQKVTAQNRVDRKIAHIEKKLECLYFPLKDAIEYLMFVYHNFGYEEEADSIPDEQWPTPGRNEKYILLIKPILSYQHLAEDNIKDDLDTFFKTINGQKPYTERSLLQFAVKLNKKVIEDISSLQNQLDELHKM